MATGSEVLRLLRPDGGWVITADDFDSIRLDNGVAPLTKQEYEAGFMTYDSWKAEQEATAQAKRTAALAKLESLGLDEDDLKALGL